MQKRLWGGVFEAGEMGEDFMEINASIHQDYCLAQHDILGSLAHVAMLKEVGILSEDELVKIKLSLAEIEQEFLDGKVEFDLELEDIHTHIEKALAKKIGAETAGKVHSGRSRNDQVVTASCLYLREALQKNIAELSLLIGAFLSKAKEFSEVPFPAFTHSQFAAVSSLGHHLHAYAEMLMRDLERFIAAFERNNVNPLGSGACAGTSLPIKREITTELLKFKESSRNSLDSVANRDFLSDYLYGSSMVMNHLSRFAAEMIQWMSQPYNWVRPDKSLCTGSSMLPQKINPDSMELIRGKASTFKAALEQCLSMTQSLPLAYNKDLQEDKFLLQRFPREFSILLKVAKKWCENLNFNLAKIESDMALGYLESIDVAEFLVMEAGLPFREAHEIVGQMVRKCLEERLSLTELIKKEPESFHKSLKKLTDLKPETLLKTKQEIGHPGAAKENIKLSRQKLEKLLEKMG